MLEAAPTCQPVSLTDEDYTRSLDRRVLSALERVNLAYRHALPGFSSDVGANQFDYALEDFRKAIAEGKRG